MVYAYIKTSHHIVNIQFLFVSHILIKNQGGKEPNNMFAFSFAGLMWRTKEEKWIKINALLKNFIYLYDDYEPSESPRL